MRSAHSEMIQRLSIHSREMKGRYRTNHNLFIVEWYDNKYLRKTYMQLHIAGGTSQWMNTILITTLVDQVSYPSN